jgi:hypothetical protein
MALKPGRPVKIAFAVVFAFLLLSGLASAQLVVKVNDDVNFRFGTLIQTWADWTQDPNSGGYSQNIFLRRVRFLLLASVAKNVSLFYQTDNPRLGNAGTNGNKIVNTGFLTLDAFCEWKIAGDVLMLDAGLFIVPSSRNALTRASNYLAFDIGAFAVLGNSLEQGIQTRDFGAGVHGYLGNERLEYRLAALDGRRQSSAEPAPPGSAGSRNPYRIAGRLNYDFFELEHGDTLISKYVYAGTNLGAKKVVAVGAWGDGQGPYKAYGADFMFDWPIVRDAVTVTGDYQHFEQDITNPTLPKQNDINVDGGYYFDAFKLQPFAVYQKQNFSDEARKTQNQQRYGGGLNWYLSGNNLKFSLLYERIVPATKPVTAKIKDTNRVAIQLQAYYF